MHSKAILQSTGCLDILLDSKSFETSLMKGDVFARKILNHFSYENFRYFRTPHRVVSPELSCITEFEEVRDDSGDIRVLRLHDQTFRFGWSPEIILNIAQGRYSNEHLSQDEIAIIRWVFVANRFCESNKTIYVTSDKFLLEQRGWFENQVPAQPLHIVSLAEACEVMNLFAKYRRDFLEVGNCYYNKEAWYWNVFRCKLPHYAMDGAQLQAFANRCNYILKSLDEMGFQFFLGVNHDTRQDLLYHFNYFLALVTGVIDGLALIAKEKLDIEFPGDHIPARTSFNPKAGKDFLGKLRELNTDLRDFVAKHSSFILLLYDMRQLAIHREMHEDFTFQEVGTNSNWNASLIKISDECYSLVRQCGDCELPYDKVSKWGILKLNDVYLDPYQFAKTATRRLLPFADYCLELMGYSNSFDDTDTKNVGYINELKRFDESRLGF